MGKLVDHGIADALGTDHVVAFEDSQVLRQQGGLDFRVGEDLADWSWPIIGRQDLEDADSGRMGERLEQVRLDLVKGLLGTTWKLTGHGTT